MKEKILGLLRILMGWIFLWPFLDKLLGLGFAISDSEGDIPALIKDS